MSWADTGVLVKPSNFSDSYKKNTSPPESVQGTQLPTAAHTASSQDITEMPDGNTCGYTGGDS